MSVNGTKCAANMRIILTTRAIVDRVALSMACKTKSLLLAQPIITKYHTHIVLIGIDSFGIKPFFPFLVALFYVLADPNVPVEPQNQIDTTRQTDEM